MAHAVTWGMQDAWLIRLPGTLKLDEECKVVPGDDKELPWLTLHMPVAGRLCRSGTRISSIEHIKLIQGAAGPALCGARD